MTVNDQPISNSQSLVNWEMTRKFLLLFLLGFFLAVGFAVLISFGNGEPIEDQSLFGDQWFIINRTYLALTLAGTLGGLLCSFLVEEDKVLEFPSWAKHNKGLKPGFIGDILVGIAGAFIAYIVLPQELKGKEIITIFVAGLVGGYGGEYVMKAALKRLIQRMEEADLTQEKLEEIGQIEQVQNLANQQIFEGLNPEELINLETQIQSFSLDPEVKEQIFDAARDARRLGARVKAYDDRINRVTPILESLVDSEPGNDRYRVQLACAYRDYIPPRLDEAIIEFNKAIKLRDKDPNKANKWQYELDRVVAFIHQAVQQGQANSIDSLNSEDILEDLNSINRNHGLSRVFLEFDEPRTRPIQQWLEKNQKWIKEHPEGKSLLAQTTILSPVPAAESPWIQPFGASSINGFSRKPLTTRIATNRRTSSLLSQFPTVKRSAIKTLIKPDRWDRALKKAFAISKGASLITAKQDGLRTAGVGASEKMAQTDWPRVEKYIDRFYKAAVKYDVPPALLAAVSSRESRTGNILKNGGWGDLQNGDYQGFGIMQVDKKSHTPNTSEGPGGQAHINQATAILVNCLRKVQQKHPSWSDEYILKGAVAAL